MGLGTAGKGKEHTWTNLKDDGYVQGLGDWNGYNGSGASSQMKQTKWVISALLHS